MTRRRSKSSNEPPPVAWPEPGTAEVPVVKSNPRRRGWTPRADSPVAPAIDRATVDEAPAEAVVVRDAVREPPLGAPLVDALVVDAAGPLALPTPEPDELGGTAAWRSFARLAFVSGVGLAAVSASMATVGAGQTIAEPLFWAGLLLVAVPVTARLASMQAGEGERVALVVLLGSMLNLVHLVRSPSSFTGYDELLHFRTLTDVLASGRLLQENPLLAISPHFPALETIVAGVVQVGGASPFVAANVVLAVVRVLFAIALYVLYREASSSDRVAGLATAVYMLNPNFTFFDSQFSYETLALPYVPLLLFVTAMRARDVATVRLGLAIVAITATLAITHHITIVAAAALLLGWLAVRLTRHRRDEYGLRAIAVSTAVVVIGAVASILSVGPLIASYLGPPLSLAVTGVIGVLTGGEGRALFQSGSGQTAAAWEPLAGLAMAGLLAAAIPIGGLVILRSLRQRSLALVLGLVACAYPLSLLARFSPAGSEAAGRSLSIIFFGLGLVVALAIVHGKEAIAAVAERLGQGDPIDEPGRRQRLGALVRRLGTAAGRLDDERLRPRVHAAFGAAVAVVVIGGAVLGSSPATRFPGGYLVGADRRSIDDVSIEAAAWANAVLGPNVRIAADRTNRLLMGALGHEYVVFHGSVGTETWQLFLSPTVGPAEIARARDAGVRYIVIDQRLTTALPLVPFYYEEGEIFEGRHDVPVAESTLAKWDAVRAVDRVYDSGPIRIYDLERLVAGG